MHVDVGKRRSAALDSSNDCSLSKLKTSDKERERERGCHHFDGRGSGAETVSSLSEQNSEIEREREMMSPSL